MNLPQRLQLQDYLFWAVVLGLILLSALMVLPFSGAIISAYILAYLVRPLYLKLEPKGGSSLAALTCMLVAILLVIIPIGLISLQILNEIGGVSNGHGLTSVIDDFVAQPLLTQLGIDPQALKAWMVSSIETLESQTLQAIPAFGLSLVITLNGMFYLLTNWDVLAAHLKKYMPFKNKEKIFTELGNTADSIIHGHVLISILEGVIAFVGFSLVGVPAALIFSVLIFILAFVPSIGPMLIWLPLALYEFSLGHYGTMWGVLATGLILMIGIEFYLYTRFVGNRSHIHPFVMLIGVLGGITVFGIFGFIIGPLLLANSIRLIEEAIVSRETGKPRATG